MEFLQDARKGVLFDDFPPVLQLQLKRFEYDFRRDIMVKARTPAHLHISSSTTFPSACSLACDARLGVASCTDACAIMVPYNR